VPISFREWKGKVDNPHVVPNSVKNLLWEETLKHFTLPEGVEPNNVKVLDSHEDGNTISEVQAATG
jgi:hypothetical protein